MLATVRIMFDGRLPRRFEPCMVVIDQNRQQSISNEDDINTECSKDMK